MVRNIEGHINLVINRYQHTRTCITCMNNLPVSILSSVLFYVVKKEEYSLKDIQRFNRFLSRRIHTSHTFNV